MAVVYAAATCESTDSRECAIPKEGTEEAAILDQARRQAAFTLLYPCELPLAERLISFDVVGERGRQTTILAFDGPFEITYRQSQIPPALSAELAGSSSSRVDLFPNVQATLIERNDGSRQALYHLLWDQEGIFYEVLAVGPPLQRRQILLFATSLQ